jgi:hypothetical protein
MQATVRKIREENPLGLNALKQYSLATLLIVALVYLMAGLFLDSTNREGVGIALLVSYPVQLLAFFLLIQSKKPGANFIVWWGAGMALRFTVVLIVALVAMQVDFSGREALLLTLVGSFFFLVLAEPKFLNPPDRVGASG